MFKKGRGGWNKGMKMSAEACKNMSLAHIGKLKGAENPNWKGGKPKCAVCNKQLTNKIAVHCPKHKPSANKRNCLYSNTYKYNK